MDPRRGNQWASLDMNYQLGSSSSDRGSGSTSNMDNNNSNSNSNSNNSRITKFQEDAGESSSTSGSTFGNLEAGKGVESSRPSSQLPSPKLAVAARSSSGSQRVQRALLQGQWSALQGFVADNDLNDAGLDHHGGNIGLGLGLSSTSSQQLGVSEEIIVHPAHVQCGFSSGRGSRPGTFEGRTGGQVVGGGIINGEGIGNNRQVSHDGDDYEGRNGLEDGTLDDNVGGNLAYNSLSMMNQLDLGNDDGRSVMDEQGEGNSGAAGSILTTTNLSSFFLEQPLDLQKEAQFQGGSSSSNNNNNFAAATETFLAGASSRSQGLYNDLVVECGTNGLHYVEDIHSLRSNSGGNMMSAFDNSSAAGYGHVSMSSRSSACKRKSCAPVPPGSLSAPSISNSPHRTAFRENLSGSAFRSLEIVPSTSDSPSMEWCPAPPQVPSRLEQGTSLSRERPTEDSFLELSLRGEGRHGKSVAGSSSSASGTTNSQRSLRTGGVGVVLTDPAANTVPQNSSSPFSHASRRAPAAAMPILPNSFTRQRTSLSFSSSMDAADEGSPGFVVDHMSNTVGHQARQQAEIPLLGGGGGGGGSRRDTFFETTSTLGERFTHRYLGNNAVASVSSANHQRSLRGSINHHQHHHNESASMPSHISPPQSPPLPLTLQSSVRTSSSPSPSRPPPHPPVLRRSSMNNSLLPPPSPSSGPAPSRLPPSPPSPLNPLLFSPSIHSLPSPTALFRGSLLPASSSTAAGAHDRGFASAAESLLGMPFRGLHMSAGSDGGTQPRIVAEGLAEILLALERVERDEDLTYEQLLMLEATLLFGGMGIHDQHSDLRLDVDNMSYEELLALEERIGNVSTGLTPDEVVEKLTKSYYSSVDAVTASYSEEYDIKCSICQEEYEDGDELGKIDCGHGYHVQCIQQWLVQKNQCPICKAAA